MTPVPTDKVSIKIGGGGEHPDAHDVLSPSGAQEVSGRELAGIVQQLKQLKDKTHNIVDISLIEDPQNKKQILNGLEAYHKQPIFKTFDIKLGSRLEEVSIPVSTENMKHIHDLVKDAVKEAGAKIHYEDDIIQAREVTTSILGNLQNGLENLAKPVSQHQAQRK